MSASKEDAQLARRFSRLTQDQRKLVLRRLNVLKNRRVGVQQIPSRAKGEPGRPASTLQQTFWSLQQMCPNSQVYNLPIAAYLAHRIDPDVLQRVMDEIIRRHAVFRTSLRLVSGQLRQVIAPTVPQASIAVVDLEQIPTAKVDRVVDRIFHEQARRTFDLANGPLLRVVLLQLPYHSIFLLIVHHAVFDGWSAAIFVRELSTLYDAFNRGLPSPLSEPAIQFADYVEWQLTRLKRGDFDDHIAYWRRQLGDLSAEPLFGQPLPPAVSRGFIGRQHPVVLSRELTAGLNALCRRAGTTLFMTVLAVLKTVLLGYCGRQWITVCAARSNRDQPETRDVIGCFVNMLPLSTRVRGEYSFLELLDRVRASTLDGFANSAVPFEHVIRELRAGKKVRELFQVAFALQNAPVPKTQVVTHVVQVDNGTTKYDLGLNLTQVDGRLEGFIEYDTLRFQQVDMVRLAKIFQATVLQVVVDPECRIAEILDRSEAQGLALA